METNVSQPQRSQQHLSDLIQKLPKAELHLHIEGTLEPEMLLALAQRNKVKIPYHTVEDLRQAYQFNNLQDFLNIYYAGTLVLQQEQDFYDLAWAYLQKAHQQRVCHAEIFFDPQSHTNRGISFGTVIRGLYGACQDAERQWGLTSSLFLCFLRHLEEETAFATLESALPYREWITGVGLDSSEIGHPPAKFQQVFAKAGRYGFLPVAHAGEEGPSNYIWQALTLLNVKRIDHGNRAMGDEKLLQELAQRQIPLTMCPLSNLKLKVITSLTQHPLKKMLDRGLLVTINSDDPSYFGGYINKNYLAIAGALSLNVDDIIKLAKNSFKASLGFHDQARLQLITQQIDQLRQEINP